MTRGFRRGLGVCAASVLAMACAQAQSSFGLVGGTNGLHGQLVAAPPAFVTRARTCPPRILTAQPPDGTGNWKAVFTRGRTILIGSGTDKPPYERSVTVGPGVYEFRVTWSKAGRPDVTSAPLVWECILPPLSADAEIQAQIDDLIQRLAALVVRGGGR